MFNEIKEKYTDSPVKYTGKIAKGSNTNIIYITNQCNFRCEYCFEGLNQSKIKKWSVTKEHLKNVIDKIFQENPQNSCIVFFGGEPLLEWDLIKYAMEYCDSLNKTKMCFSMNTNGYRFKNKDFFNEFISNKFVKAHRLAIDLSFDGVGNFRRKTNSLKDTTQDMIAIMLNLNKANIPFRVSYTVHNGNKSLISKDILMIEKTFKPERIVVNFNSQELSFDEIDKYKNELRKVYHITHLPLCNVVCDECTLCGIRTETYKYYNNKNDVYTKPASSITGKINLV